MDDINKQIGKRIRIIREGRNLTQAELGQILGVEKASISKYEAGDAKRGVPVEFLVKISELGPTESSLEWLLTGETLNRETICRPYLEELATGQPDTHGAAILPEGAAVLIQLYNQLTPENQRDLIAHAAMKLITERQKDQSSMLWFGI